jgi:hypothetical protein
MKITHNWEIKGHKIELICKLVLEKEINPDLTVECCDIKTEVLCDGISQGNWIRDLPEELRNLFFQKTGVNYVSACGKVLLTEEKLNLIQDAYTKFKMHPAYLAKVKDTSRENDAKGFGFCSKCESYCYGDCK